MDVIFVPNITPRLTYLENELFVQRNIPLRFSNSDNKEKEVIPISSLLFEVGISPELSIEKESFEGVSCLSFYKCTCPLSTIFFNLTRYEEYNAEELDEHGRFSAKQSWSYRAEMLHLQWNERLLEAFLKKYFPHLLRFFDDQQTLTVVPSFDIDQTRAYEGKSGWRKWGSIWKDRLTNHSQRLKERKQVAIGSVKDPFDSFEAISKVAQDYPETRVFWLLAPWSEYDRNMNWNAKETVQSIQKVAHAKLGIHPGYRSNSSDSLLTEEFRRFKVLTGEAAVRSRQHFLKLSFPQTYRRLIKQGILEDATMGYADQVGFRAGTAHPFRWFDLSTNEATELVILPFFYMDGTFRQYLKKSVEQAIVEMKIVAMEIKRYGGTACFIWHNESFAEPNEWKGWKQLFDATLDTLKE